MTKITVIDHKSLIFIVLSILIPTYNHCCLELVKSLRGEPDTEIIVADDGSADLLSVSRNEEINRLPGCRYVRYTENRGRAAIRNALAKLASGSHLLFIDSDMTIVSKDFLANYRKAMREKPEAVFCGGYTIPEPETQLLCNLRYRYEHKYQRLNKFGDGYKQSSRNFHTSNFLIPRRTLLEHPFNEEMRTYGYEDVLLGKQLSAAGVEIAHIDNPVGFGSFETNEEFLGKTLEAVRTQYAFAGLIGSYSTLITTHRKLRRLRLHHLLTPLSALLSPLIRHNLLSQKPNIMLFNLYKLLRYHDLTRKALTLLLLLALSVSASAQMPPKKRQQSAMHMDIANGVVAADKAKQGLSLPQAFNGEGVVLGVTDIGFDFTHPTFSNSNIFCFWDMLSRDTLGSHTPVFTGRDYDKREIQTLRRSYDGAEETHGTHVLGIAAGEGFRDAYQGIAPKADIALIGNVLSDNYKLVDSLQKDKFGGMYEMEEFQYLFDRAAEEGKPCVINISAGSRQSFGDDFPKYNQQMSEMLGPGRILVASAGNNGGQLVSLHKDRGQSSAGSMAVLTEHQYCYLFLQKDEDVQCDILFSPDGGGTKLTLPEEEYIALDTLSDYDLAPVRYYFFITDSLRAHGYGDLFVRLSGEGEGHIYTQSIQFLNSGADDGFNDASNLYGVHFPAAFDDVICVAGTDYRNEIINYKGELKTTDNGELGRDFRHSSRGPRLDGYQKPDIAAPASCVISSYSSFYEEAHPEASDVSWDRERFSYGGRTYSWNSNSGTSMSSPVVAGVIALWLQADPTLTPQRIKEVFSRTAKHPDPTLSYPNEIYGYGEIDAYAGLLDILGLTAIEGVSHHQPQGLRFRMENSALVLSAPDIQHSTFNFQLSVYSTSGTLLSQHSLSSLPAEIPLPPSHKGVLLVQVNAQDKALCGSTLIRVK